MPALQRLLDELTSVHLGANQPSDLVDVPHPSPESGVEVSPRSKLQYLKI